jgi:hypothetical protein
MGEIRAVTDYRDLTGGRSRIGDTLLLEKMTPFSSRLRRHPNIAANRQCLEPFGSFNAIGL